MNLTYAFISVIIMATVTYITRVFPIVVFRREIRSKYIKSFLRYIPYAVLGALTFPDIFYSGARPYPAQAFLLLIRRQSLFRNHPVQAF